MTCSCPTCGQAVADVEWRIDAEAGVVIGLGKVVALPRREMAILEYLWSRRGRMVSRSVLFDAVYAGDDAPDFSEVVESHVSKLRKKIRPLGIVLHSERFKGYQLRIGGAA